MADTLKIIYTPKGRAREYAALAANLCSGCIHRCKYCWVPRALRRDRAEFHRTSSARKNVLKLFEADCEILSGRVDVPPILLSFTTDPYQPMETEMKLTRRAIGIAHKYGLAIEILTKGGMRAARDFDLLTDKDAFATTLTFLDDTLSAYWEPLAASPESRLSAMQEAHRRGLRVWASLEPVIDPEHSLELIARTQGYVDLYKVGKWNYDPRANNIDWHDFGWKAKAVLDAAGSKYLIKDDLKKLMGLQAAEAPA